MHTTALTCTLLAASAASAQVVDGREYGLRVHDLTNQNIEAAQSYVQLLGDAPRLEGEAFNGDGYILSAGYLDLLGGGARLVDDGSGVSDPHLDALDGTNETYASFDGSLGVTQLGDVVEVAELLGTTGSGTSTLQISLFSTTGTTLDALDFGFNGFTLNVGVDSFVGSVADDGIALDLGPGEFVEVLGVSFGFFDADGNLVGSGVGDDLSGATGIAGGFGADVSTIAPFVEAFVLFEYRVVPAPAGVGLLAAAGLAAVRRRR